VRYRDVPLEEMVALNHSIRCKASALLAHEQLLTEVMHSKNHKSIGQLRRAATELTRMAAEIEGRALRTFGSTAWDHARRAHWAQCDEESLLLCAPVETG
jgi:hypothetical protein